VPAQAKPATPAEPATPKKRPALAPIVAGIVGIIVIAGGAWWYEHRVTLPSNPSIAVMPFEDIGGDAASDRLAPGITIEIAADFSRFRDFDVIDSAATEAYGKRGADARQIAGDFNVRYVLRGSIQREDDNIQLNAQLFDGMTGGSLWSKRWDRPATDIFAVQNEVAEGIISLLGDHNLMVGLSAAAARRKAPSDLVAYDLYALGYESFAKGTEEGFAEALRYADAAIAKNPQSCGLQRGVERADGLNRQPGCKMPCAARLGPSQEFSPLGGLLARSADRKPPASDRGFGLSLERLSPSPV
jgi:TolB-like protein